MKKIGAKFSRYLEVRIAWGDRLIRKEPRRVE